MFAAKLKKAIAVFCLAAILFSSFHTAAFAAYENTYTNTGDRCADLIGVAKTQLGYTEGSNGYTKYGDFYGWPYIDWCGAFIVWCAAEAGVETTVIPKNASSNGLKDFYDARGRYYLSYGHGGSYTPKAGDIAFMSASNSPNDITHVGIVISYTEGTIITIEGNYSDRVTQVSYPETTVKIVGFAAPMYGNRIGYYKLDTTMRLRAEPNTDADILTTIPGGTVVTVTKISGDWGYVTYYGYSGWMNLDYSVFQRGLDTADNDVIPMPKEALYLAADVSQFNHPAAFDWAKLKASGVEAVIIRIAGRGYGYARQLYRDNSFLQHYKNAKAAGLHVGVYFFSYAMTAAQAREEAQMTIDLLHEYECEPDMPVFIDIEDYAPQDYSHERAGKAACTTVVNTFCSVIADAGYYPGVYCNKFFAENLLEPSAFENKAVWIAHYGVTKCGYSGRYDMWQYTSYGSVSGYSGDLDLNYVYTDFPALIANNGISGSFGSHVPGDWEIAAEPTCTTQGERLVKCKDCGEVLVRETLQRAHTESQHFIQLARTEIKIGSTVTDEILSTLHGENERNYADVYLLSYEQDGGTLLTYCTACGKVLSTVYSYGDEAHEHTETGSLPSTCQTEGMSFTVCNDCDRVLSQTLLPYASHTPGGSTPRRATCTEDGKRITVCAVCGETTREEFLSAGEHQFGPGKQTVEVSPLHNGVIEYACMLCSTVITEEIPAPKYGDIDGDQTVTAKDARLALRSAVGLERLTDMQTVAGDIDHTGTVEIGDARYILRIAVGLDKPQALLQRFYAG